MNSTHGDLIYFTDVRWLRFIYLKTESKIFLQSKDSCEQKLDVKIRLADFAFLTDVIAKLNTLNETLQGRKKLILAFVNKINLQKRQLEKKSFQHFPLCTLLLYSEYFAV